MVQLFRLHTWKKKKKKKKEKILKGLMIMFKLN